MKNIFVLVSIMALLFLTACGSGPSPAPAQPAQPTFRVSAVTPDRTVTVNYTVSDSAAFSLAHVWVTQNFLWHSFTDRGGGIEERDPITVNDPASGVLAGEYSMKSSFVMRGRLQSEFHIAQFRIFINDGTATFTLSRIAISYSHFYAYSQQEAQDRVQQIIDNWAERLADSFSEAFF